LKGNDKNRFQGGAKFGLYLCPRRPAKKRHLGRREYVEVWGEIPETDAGQKGYREERGSWKRENQCFPPENNLRDQKKKKEKERRCNSQKGKMILGELGKKIRKKTLKKSVFRQKVRGD